MQKEDLNERKGLHDGPTLGEFQFTERYIFKTALQEYAVKKLI